MKRKSHRIIIHTMKGTSSSRSGRRSLGVKGASAELGPAVSLAAPADVDGLSEDEGPNSLLTRPLQEKIFITSQT